MEMMFCDAQKKHFVIHSIPQTNMSLQCQGHKKQVHLAVATQNKKEKNALQGYLTNTMIILKLKINNLLSCVIQHTHRH